MTGLEKVTGKILADAEADAKEILDQAEAECAAIRARFEASTESQLEALREQSDRECQALIIRARSSAAMAKRDALLNARAKLLDEAYAQAEKQFRNMNAEQYLELLQKLLRSALKRQLEGEEESMRLYGEDIAPASYEVVLSPRDRDGVGGLSDLVAAAITSRLQAGQKFLRCVQHDQSPFDLFWRRSQSPAM